MPLKKRGSIWWIDFYAPDGTRVRRSAETEDKGQAKELEAKLKSDAWRLRKLGQRPKRIWQDAVVRYLKESAHKATHNEDLAKLRWLDRFLAGREIETINRELIDRITEAKLAEGVSNATVNRTLALVRTILRRCHRDWEWVNRGPSVRLLKEPTRRIRCLTPTEAATLLKELPVHLRDMATFTLATGLRAANVSGLTWQQVDLERRQAFVHPDQAKARKAIPVPLNDVAMDVLRRQQGNHFVRVFCYEGEPINQVNTKAWRKALKRAGIQDFRWHDLRHTWASWHVQAGTPLFALQELAGWESERMVRRYAHLAASHLAPYAERVGVLGTNWAQSANASSEAATGGILNARNISEKLVPATGFEPVTP
jgi:integrase